jgi:hypothetical protein
LTKRALSETEFGRGRFEPSDVGPALRGTPFTLGVADDLLEIGLSVPRENVRAIHSPDSARKVLSAISLMLPCAYSPTGVGPSQAIEKSMNGSQKWGDFSPYSPVFGPRIAPLRRLGPLHDHTAGMEVGVARHAAMFQSSHERWLGRRGMTR